VAAASSDRHNDQHSHGIINAAGSADDDFASLHDLFDLAEDDGRSSDRTVPPSWRAISFHTLKKLTQWETATQALTLLLQRPAIRTHEINPLVVAS
jgi:hypothetical protein